MGVATSCLIRSNSGDWNQRNCCLRLRVNSTCTQTSSKSCRLRICEVGRTVQALDSSGGMLIVLKMRLQSLGIMLERIVEDRRAAGLARSGRSIDEYVERFKRVECLGARRIINCRCGDATYSRRQTARRHASGASCEVTPALQMIVTAMLFLDLRTDNRQARDLSPSASTSFHLVTSVAVSKLRAARTICNSWTLCVCILRAGNLAASNLPSPLRTSSSL